MRGPAQGPRVHERPSPPGAGRRSIHGAVEGTGYAVVADLTLTIAAGDTSGTASFKLTPVDDAVDEPDESLTVTGSATGLTAGSATLTIGDDDERGVPGRPAVRAHRGG